MLTLLARISCLQHWTNAVACNGVIAGMNTTTGDTVLGMDTLLTHGEWLRRMATALVQDSFSAEDLQQETWIAALHSRPKTAEAARGWLRKVFKNRLLDAQRARRRREIREQATIAPVGENTTPEEHVQRMELFQQLVAHISSLDESTRTVLMLRYFDGLEPVEIGKKLNIPGSTVRWRIKRGLDELRARLDKENGGNRKNWCALLMPMVYQGTASLGKGLWRWVVAVCLALVAGYFGYYLLNEQEKESVSNSFSRHANSNSIAPFESSEIYAGNMSEDCAPAQELEKEARQLEQAAQYLINPKTIYDRSLPNSEAENKLRSKVEAMIYNLKGRHEVCGLNSFSCRGPVCRVAVTSGYRNRWGEGTLGCFEPQAAFEFKKYLSKNGFTHYTVFEGTAFDPFARQYFSNQVLYFRLANEDGSPASSEQNLGALKPGWDRERGPIPEEYSPECREWIAKAQQNLKNLVEQIQKNADPRLVHKSATPNPELNQEVAETLASFNAENEPSLRVDCRGSLCALYPLEERDDDDVVWVCTFQPLFSESICSFSKDYKGDWFSDLEKKVRNVEGKYELISGPTRVDEQDFPAILRVRPIEEQNGVSGLTLSQQLAGEAGFASIIASCEKQYPSTGLLMLSINVPDTTNSQEAGISPRITIDISGDLFGSPLAKCVSEAISQPLAEFPVPPHVYGWKHELFLQFPHPKIDLEKT